MDLSLEYTELLHSFNTQIFSLQTLLKRTFDNNNILRQLEKNKISSSFITDLIVEFLTRLFDNFNKKQSNKGIIDEFRKKVDVKMKEISKKIEDLKKKNIKYNKKLSNGQVKNFEVMKKNNEMKKEIIKMNEKLEKEVKGFRKKEMSYNNRIKQILKDYKMKKNSYEVISKQNGLLNDKIKNDSIRLRKMEDKISRLKNEKRGDVKNEERLKFELNRKEMDFKILENKIVNEFENKLKSKELRINELKLKSVSNLEMRKANFENLLKLKDEELSNLENDMKERIKDKDKLLIEKEFQHKEELENLEQKCKQRINELENIKKDMENEISELKSNNQMLNDSINKEILVKRNLQNQIKQKNINIEKINKSIQNEMFKKFSISEKMSKVKNNNLKLTNDLKKMKQSNDRLKEELDKERSVSGGLKNDIEKKQRMIQKNKEDLLEEKKAKEALIEEVNLKNSNSLEIQKSLLEKNNEIKKLNNEKGVLNGELEKCKSVKEQVEKKLNLIVVENKLVKQELKQEKKSKGMFKNLYNDLSEQYNDVSQKSNSIHMKNKKLQELVDQNDKMIDEKNNNVINMSEKISVLKKKNSELIRDVDNLKNEIDRQKNQKNEMYNKLNQLNQNNMKLNYSISSLIDNGDNGEDRNEDISLVEKLENYLSDLKDKHTFKVFALNKRISKQKGVIDYMTSYQKTKVEVFRRKLSVLKHDLSSLKSVFAKNLLSLKKKSINDVKVLIAMYNKERRNDKRKFINIKKRLVEKRMNIVGDLKKKINSKNSKILEQETHISKLDDDYRILLGNKNKMNDENTLLKDQLNNLNNILLFYFPEIKEIKFQPDNFNQMKLMFKRNQKDLYDMRVRLKSLENQNKKLHLEKKSIQNQLDDFSKKTTEELLKHILFKKKFTKLYKEKYNEQLEKFRNQLESNEKERKTVSEKISMVGNQLNSALEKIREKKQSVCKNDIILSSTRNSTDLLENKIKEEEREIKDICNILQNKMIYDDDDDGNDDMINNNLKDTLDEDIFLNEKKLDELTNY